MHLRPERERARHDKHVRTALIACHSACLRAELACMVLSQQVSDAGLAEEMSQTSHLCGQTALSIASMTDPEPGMLYREIVATRAACGIVREACSLHPHPDLLASAITACTSAEEACEAVLSVSPQARD